MSGVHKALHRTAFPLRSKAAGEHERWYGFVCQEGVPLPWHRDAVRSDNSSPIGEAAGSSVTTVDQADMRALVSRKTVVRHGAASL